MTAGSDKNRPPSLEERLERGEVEYFPVCPFPMPQGEDHEFLLEQRPGEPCT